MEVQQPKSKNKKKVLWIVLGIAILIALIVAYWYFFVFPKDVPLKKKPATSLKKFVVSAGKDFTKVNNNILVSRNGIIAQKGDKGLQVKQLQRYLNQQKGAGIAEDGNWGDLTQAALINAKIPVNTAPVVSYLPDLPLDSNAKINSNYYTKLTEYLYNELNLQSY